MRSTRGVATIRANFDNAAKKGRLAPDQVARSMALLEPTLDYGDLRDADLVIEAVFEDMAIKQQVFATLDDMAKPGAILATNTSTLDVDRIAAGTQRPQDVLGMHFFSPANVMKLLEVVRGERTGADVLATVMQLAKRIGKTAVVSGVCDGFIGNRMIEQYLRQAMFLLEEGASPAQVDGALEQFGMAMGPFRMSDLAGNDVGWRIRQRRYVEKPHVRYSRIADRLCERRPLRPEDGRRLVSLRGGTARRAARSRGRRDHRSVSRRNRRRRRARIDADEIVERCILALVNEGARIARGRHRAARVRHRRRLPRRLRLSALSRRADALRRHARASTTWCAACARSRAAPGATLCSGRPRRCSRVSRPRAARSTDDRAQPLAGADDRMHRSSRP